jgi:multidrug efflux pump
VSVICSGDALFRSKPEDIDQWSVRNNQGEMVPFSSFARTGWSTAPVGLSRFLGVQSYEFQGQPVPGKSSGDAMEAIEALASKIPGVGIAWSGQSYEERLSSGQAPLLYAISLLSSSCAALYKGSIPSQCCWSSPGLVGAFFAVKLRDCAKASTSDRPLTTVGWRQGAAMIEFAERAEAERRVIMQR